MTAHPLAGPRPNPWIGEIDAYVGGSAKGGGHADPVKLSSNENPWGASPRALAALAAAAGTSNRYPDGGAAALRAKIGALYGLDPDRIVCGTGSGDMLQLLPAIYCAPGDTVVHVQHGFMLYPITARRAGAKPIEAPDRDFTADVDAILKTVRADTRIVILANPNNPTGTMIEAAEVARLHAGLRDDVLLVLDQAYTDYLDGPDPDGGLALARTAPNVVVTRTLSKIYGLGGLRVGWATGPAAIIAELNRVRAPFPISVPALAAAEAAIEDQDFVADCRARNRVQRTLLADAIARLGNKGLRAVPSEANFVLMTCPDEGPLMAEALHRGLAERGFITRWLPAQGLPNALRISVGTEDETAGVIAALTEIAEAG
ncbi:MAG: histidinol-phosphate transaminase [Sandaracinobacter sp.]